MTRREMLNGMLATLLLFASGCVVEDRSGRRHDTYYYYPDYEIYFYPRVARYYWRERDEWRWGPNPPPRYTLRDRDRVRFDWDREPHRDHDRVRQKYPPGRRDRD